MAVRVRREPWEPRVIQGGMGVGVSCWQLAGAVSAAGQLGVVSGTALDFVLARRLQEGDPGGHARRALAAFVDPALATRVLDRFFVPGGLPRDTPYRGPSLPTLSPRQEQLELLVAAAFVEVFLAKERAGGAPVGINFLMKIAMPLLPSLYGAMLAGVDVVIAGAGSPRAIPAVLDALARHEDTALDVKVLYAREAGAQARFSPRATLAAPAAPLRRPRVLAIVASVDLAADLAGAARPPDGFVVEGPTAGGHNAPPRGAVAAAGGPLRYDARDEVDLDALRALGLPFWLAGGHGRAGALARAEAAGASGIQVGTAFAFCRESGLDPALRARVLEAVRQGRVDVRTDGAASPTGFPFKVAAVEGTLSEPEVVARRPRVCDVGLLRAPYESQDGSLGYRCPSEPAAPFERKRGLPRATEGRLCLCNGLLAAIGLGQRRKDGSLEPPLVTAGDDLPHVAAFLPPGAEDYGAADVLATLLA